ncbi:glutamine--fructose-6-phosphate transaminase (isomerizing) [Candidatus Uhrbacteria bacterium]|nr:glutamine--fructose-6-phosphate transaminase (isomerizing) [Candidatus Uhrbacteria bacterium]
MCGIIGYVGAKPATPILMEGLKQLEYRGYDSAGMCVQNGKLTTVRSEGKIAQLEEKVLKFEMYGTCGIAHTRWATHGVPDERNAHPHRDCTGGVAMVHNGIIENYQELKGELIDHGHSFASDTDSEVLAHLIEDELEVGTALFMAVKRVLSRVRGTYGVVVITRDTPQTLIAARMGSPLVIGIGEGEYFIASDPSAIIAHTKDVLYLDDGEIAAVTSEGVSLDGVEQTSVQDRVAKIDWDVEEATKAGHPHFMLKEILEQPEVIENSIRGRVDLLHGRCVLGGLEGVRDRLSEIDRIVIVGCGSAYYAGLVGEYLLEELAGIPVEVELASEFRYRKPLLTSRTAVLAISQSGETADTLEAVREAKRKNVLTLGLVNVVGSSIARETDAGVYNHAGSEVGVASTKAFVSQLTVLTLMAVYLGQLRGTLTYGGEILAALCELPAQVREILDRRQEIVSIALTLKGAEHCLFLGRTLHAPIAYEGALKLKEVSYVHAEGYTSGEMKHGPIALIREGFPCVVLCPQDGMFEKNWSNIQELKARGGHIIAITSGEPLSSIESQVVLPQTHEVLQPILSTIPLQLLAYEVAVARDLDPDRPRNLAKSVTVE